MLLFRRTVSSIGLVLAAAALLASPASAETATHSFLFSLRGFFIEPSHIPVPPPEAEFEDACGVATDEFGDTYVSDYYHRTIDIYGPNGYLTQIADPDPDGPCNLAVDSSGHLYVNHWHRNVVRLTPSAFPPGPSTTYGSQRVIDSARSTGLTIDPASGNIFVDDRTYVAVYEPSGEAVLAGGEPLKIGLGSLASGYGVAVSGFPATRGDVYVADAVTGTVKIYDPAIDPAHPAKVVEGTGTPQKGFASLTDSNLAVDSSSGHLYVLDNTEAGFEHPIAVVDEFNPSGDYRGQITQYIFEGTRHAFINAEPSGLMVDQSTGDVYVTSGNDEEATAHVFGPTVAAHSLRVTRTGAGEGAVSSEPAGIACGKACAAEYNVGAEINLSPKAAPGSAFAGWSGACTGTGVCHLTLSTDKEVNAEFEVLPPAPLSAEGGTGTAVAQGIRTLVAPASSATRSLPSQNSSKHHRHHRRRGGSDPHQKGGGR